MRDGLSSGTRPSTCTVHCEVSRDNNDYFLCTPYAPHTLSVLYLKYLLLLS